MTSGRFWARAIRLGAVLLAVLAVPATASAAITWTGQGDGSSWSDARNWSPQQVPGSGDSASIPSGLDAHVSIPAGTTVADLDYAGVNLTGGPLTVTDSFDWTQGALSLDLESLGTASISGSSQKDLSGILDLAGTTQVSDAGYIYALGTEIDNTGALTLDPGSLLVGGGSTDQFINSGSIAVPASPKGVATVTDWGDDKGTGFLDRGSVSVGKGSTLDLNGANGELAKGDSFTGPGTTRFDGGETVWLAPNVSLGSGTTLQLGPADGGGTPIWAGSGGFTGKGSISWQGGEIGGAAATPQTVTIAKGITTTVAGTQTSSLAYNYDDGRILETLELSGPLDVTGSGGLGVDDATTLDDTGSITVQPGSTISGGDAGDRLIADGPIVVPTSSGGVATLQNLGGEKGDGLLAHAGVSVGQGSTLDLFNDNGELSAGDSLTGAGTTRLDGPSRLWLAPSISLASGTTLQLGSPGESNPPSLVGSGSFAGTGTLDWDGGDIGGGTAAATVAVGAGITTDITGGGGSTLVGNVKNNHPARETLELAGPTSVTASLATDGDTALDNSGTMTAGAVTIAGTALTNTGTLDVAPGDGGTTRLTGVTFVNDGSVSIDSGTFDADAASSYTQKGGSSELAGGALSSSPTIQIAGGTLGGSGAITGSVTNSGTVQPASASGPLDISGSYAQSRTGTLAIDIGGTPGGFGQLAVGGSATLAGTLDVALVGGGSPPGKQTYPVLTYASESGTFKTLGGAAGYTVAYHPTVADVVFGK